MLRYIHKCIRMKFDCSCIIVDYYIYSVFRHIKSIDQHTNGQVGHKVSGLKLARGGVTHDYCTVLPSQKHA